MRRRMRSENIEEEDRSLIPPGEAFRAGDIAFTGLE